MILIMQFLYSIPLCAITTVQCSRATCPAALNVYSYDSARAFPPALGVLVRGNP